MFNFADGKFILDTSDNQQCILKRLKKTQKIYESAHTIAGKLEMRDFPLYSVLKSTDNLYDFSNYEDNFFSKLEGEDIRSHTVRALSFDSTGFTGAKMCIVKKVSADCQDLDGEFLERGRCIYTSILTFTEMDYGFLREKLFIDAYKWAKEHSVELKGILYGSNSFSLSGKNNEEGIYQCVTEIWIPIR